MKFKLSIDGEDIGYLKQVAHGEPLIKFVGSQLVHRVGSSTLINHPAEYDERVAKMWVKRLAKAGYVTTMTEV